MFFAKTISKMLAYKLDKYEEDIKKLDKYLRKFERTYKKDSATFLKEFNQGELGDDIAFIEWASVYQMRTRIEKKRSALEKLIR